MANLIKPTKDGKKSCGFFVAFSLTIVAFRLCIQFLSNKGVNKLDEKDDKKSRKWQITINNPLKYDYSHENIKGQLTNFKSLIYWCMSDEIGENGTPHTHLYLAFSSGVRFITVKNNFASAHIEPANGTSQQNKDYIYKEGKWANDKKSDTNLKDTHEEFGEIPVERQGARNDLNDLYDMIKSGKTNDEILKENPTYMLQLDKIDRVRQTILEANFKKVERDIDISYIWGATGTGKTSTIVRRHDYEAYRIMDYAHPWDSYAGQDAVIFEEFRSSSKIQDMLNWLDRYPLELPCRYSNKIACFTKVYIITNIPLEQQYITVQHDYPPTWKAFLRRIARVEKYTYNGVISTLMDEYLKNGQFDATGTIFDEKYQDELILS